MSSKPKTTGPTDQERAAAELGVNQWNDYQERYVPLENQYIQQMQNMPSKGAELAGIANADVWQQAKPLDTRAGLGALKDSYLNTGTQLGLATSKAAQSASDTQLRGLLKMSAYGRGLADTSNNNLYSAGQTATQAAISQSKANQQSDDAWMGGLGLAAGAGTNYFLNRAKTA
jgi:hypothetical protein